MLDVRRVEYFICCAECLNITHASKRLRISQQALSKQIQILESELGEQLFERSNTSLKLTEVGKKVYDTFKPLIRNLYHGYEDVMEFIKYKQNTIKFAYFNDIPYNQVIAPLVNRMKELKPDLRINMLAVDLGVDRELLQNDSIDFVVSIKLDDSLWQDMETHVVKKAPTKIVVSENHPWSQKTKVTEDDIANENFLLFEIAPGKSKEHYMSFIKAKERILTPNVDTFLTSLSQGMGFGVMSELRSRGHGEYRLLDLPDCYANETEFIVAYKKLHPLKKIFKQVYDMEA